VALARPGDMLLIAGKGHEDYQILGTQKIPSMIAMSPRLLSRPVPAAWLLAVPHDEAGEADLALPVKPWGNPGGLAAALATTRFAGRPATAVK